MTKIIEYGQKYDNEINLALGFFDCVHIGHRRLLEEAKRGGGETAVMTFKEDIGFILGKERQIYTFLERADILQGLDIELIIAAGFDLEWKNMSAEGFLNSLKSLYKIRKIVCGYDYAFGKDRKGDVNMLERFCHEEGIEFCAADKVLYGKERASTTLVRQLLKEGNVKEAEKVLGQKYFVKAEVIGGKQLGRQLGFPTVNMKIRDKYIIKRGVYLTEVEIEGIKHRGISNLGARPTFSEEEDLLETYIDGYGADLYGKVLKIEFVDYIRDIKKFGNADELIGQLKKDKERLND